MSSDGTKTLYSVLQRSLAKVVHVPTNIFEKISINFNMFVVTEAAAQRCSQEKVF